MPTLFLSLTFAAIAAFANEDAPQRIAEEVFARGQAFSNLQELTSGGHRLCGSQGAANAVDWANAKLSSYGLDRVFVQPVKVPAWSRGDHESAEIVGGAEGPVSMRVTALGDSAGTSSEGMTAEVLEVQSLDEVNKLGNRVRGKIVFFNRPMDPTLQNPFEAYGRAVDQRTSGPALAAHYGAIATLVRSMTNRADDAHPHTGITIFHEGSKPIPAAAVSTHDANVLSARIHSGHGAVRVHLTLSAHRNPDTISYNVLGELRGSEFPSEIVAVGGHLDSWDLSPGAHDDGAGVVQTIEVLRTLRALGLQPKRTVRAVLFMCEEQGGIGADEYALQARLLNEHHIMAIEADRGGFKPIGFSIQDNSGLGLPRLRQWAPYLGFLQADWMAEGPSGTDVEPLVEQGAIGVGLVPESTHYFDVHHSELDQLSAVDPGDLNAGAAALAILTYLGAEEGI
ncbi:M20/M25/M40 family metallo-hydrolase [Bdellovibrionota bacterium FG-1]